MCLLSFTHAFAEQHLESRSKQQENARLYDWNTIRRIPRIDDSTSFIEHWSDTVLNLARKMTLEIVAPSYALLELELQTCGGGNPRLCYLDGIAAIKKNDSVAAAKYFTRGCRGKYGPACLASAKHSESVAGVIIALKDYESACEMAMAHGCIRAAQIRQNNGQYDFVLTMIARSCFLGSETHCSGNGAILTPNLINMMAQTPAPKVMSSPTPMPMPTKQVLKAESAKDAQTIAADPPAIVAAASVPADESTPRQQSSTPTTLPNVDNGDASSVRIVASETNAVAPDALATTAAPSVNTLTSKIASERSSEKIREAIHETATSPQHNLTSCGALSAEECLAKAEEDRFEGDTENAMKLLTQLCDREVIEGCNQLAILEQKSGSRRRALALFAKNCKLGHAESCINSGDNDASVGEPFDAITKYKSACRMGAAAGCLKAATYQDANVSAEEKKNMLELACKGGLTLACTQFAALTKTEDPSRVFELQKSNCEKGSSEDCMEAAKFAKESVKQDVEAKLLAKACALGEDMACLKTAKQVAQSSLTPEDKVRKTLDVCETIDAKDCMHKADLLREEIGENAVLPVYQFACAKGGATACIRLADFDYSRGQINDSRLWHERACEFGAVGSCVSAAGLYEGEQKNERAVALYLQACNLKDGKGCYRGGNLAKQLGMTKESKSLLEEACKYGFGWDCENGSMAH